MDWTQAYIVLGVVLGFILGIAVREFFVLLHEQKG